MFKIFPTIPGSPVRETRISPQLSRLLSTQFFGGHGAVRPYSDRVSINQLTTVRWNIQQAVSAFADAEAAGIGLSWRKLKEFGVQKGIRTIERSGLPVSSVGWIGSFTNANGHPLGEVLEDSREAIRAAGRMGARTVTVISGPSAGHIQTHAWRLVRDSLKELGELAATYRLELAVQPMHHVYHRNWSFINDLDETLDLLDHVGMPSVQMCFGTYHLGHEPQLLERIPEFVHRIGLVTLSDWNKPPTDENDRLLPGDGCLPIRNIVRRLEDHGYSGWYEMEVWSRDLWKLDHRDLMLRCLEVFEDLAPENPELA